MLCRSTTQSVVEHPSGIVGLRLVYFGFDHRNDISQLSTGEPYIQSDIEVRLQLWIDAAEHAALSVLQPALGKILPQYPDIKVEIIVDYGLTDIVAERYDAGVRLGEQVAKDMIAIRVGPDLRMAVVGAPSYFEHHPMPKTPQDLTAHNCINIRFPTYGGLFAWDLEKDGREVNVRVEGQLIFNNAGLRLASALQGFGLAYMPEDQALPHIVEGRLIRVLEDWCPPFPGYHLYYPSRRHSSPAFALLVEALRFRG